MNRGFNNYFMRSDSTHAIEHSLALPAKLSFDLQCRILIGTTRSDQPALFASEPLRYARISGGVWLSFPSQNGQKPPDFSTLCLPFINGRRALSVDIITHRPVTGSFLSSGIKLIEFSYLSLPQARIATKVATTNQRRLPH